MFVLFASPCLSHQIHLDHFASFVGTHDLMVAEGIPHRVTHLGGMAFIDHARNLLTWRFLHEFPEATHLFWLDDDIGWPPDAPLRLLRRDVDIIAGVYPWKQDEVGFPVGMLGRRGVGLVERDGMVGAAHVPAGFLCMKRDAVERLAADSPTYPNRPTGDAPIETIANVWRTGYDPDSGERLGEDVDLCRRWLKMGGEIWIEPDINFSHNGRKRWGGNLAQNLDGVRQTMIDTKEKVPVEEPVA